MIALLTPSWLASKWCFAELVQTREKGKAIFPVKVKACDAGGVFGDIQHIDLTENSEEGYQRLAFGLKERGLDPRDIFVWNPKRPLYPGLEAFKEEDAAILFGRGEEILKGLETVEALRRRGRGAQRFVIFLGASGSGKSSLVRAGLIPRLKKSPSEWLPVPPFRPQDDPLDELALALADAFKDLEQPRDWSDLRRMLTAAAERVPADGKVLLDLARELSMAAKQREATVVLTIDQAEELFGYSAPDAVARFLRLLRAALEASDRQLMAMATLRSDFLGEFQTHRALHDPTYDHDFRYQAVTVDPMPERNFGEIIQGPAALAELRLEEGLVERMVRDTGTRDALPLLAFTLRRLYERYGKDGLLEIREYEELGQLEGAIREEAERILKEVNPSLQDLDALRAAFVPAMVRINADGGYARRRAYAEEMPPRANELLRRFVDTRLLVSDRDKDNRETLEVAHEALLRTWPQLSDWLAEDQDKLRLLESLHRAAEDWDNGSRSADLLVHRDGRLQDVEALITNRRFAIQKDSLEKRYLDACNAAQRAREIAEREEQERRIRDAERIAEEEKKAAMAQKKTARRTMVGLVAALVLALAAGWQYWVATTAQDEANNARKEAEEQARIALAERDEALRSESRRDALLANEARRNQEYQAALKVALGALVGVDTGEESGQTGRPYTWEAAEALVRAMHPFYFAERTIKTRADDLLAFVDDGRKLLTISRNGSWVLWLAATGERLVTYNEGGPKLSPSHWAVALAQDAGRFVTAHEDGGARLWSIDDATSIKVFQHPSRDSSNPVMSVDLTADASAVATAYYRGTWAVWRHESGWPEQPSIRGQHGPDGSGNATVALFLRQGSSLATANTVEKAITVWDLSGPVASRRGELIPFSSSGITERAMLVAVPGDTHLFVGDGRTDGRLVEASTGEITTATETEDARLVALALGGNRIAPVRRKGSIFTGAFAAFNPQDFGVTPGGVGGGYSSALSPDGRLLASVDDDGQTMVWDLERGGAHVRIHGSTSAISFSQDGAVLATGNNDRVMLWNIEEPRSVHLPKGEEYRRDNWGVADADCEHTIVDAVCHADHVQFLTSGSDRYEERAVCVHNTGTKTITKLPIIVPKGPLPRWNVNLVGDGSVVAQTRSNATPMLFDVHRGVQLDETAASDALADESKSFTADPSRSHHGGFEKISAGGHNIRFQHAESVVDLQGQKGEVGSIAISPQGDRIVTASRDGTARIWEADTGHLIDILDVDDKGVMCASFDATGQSVLTAASDFEVRKWPVARFTTHASLVERATKLVREFSE